MALQNLLDWKTNNNVVYPIDTVSVTLETMIDYIAAVVARIIRKSVVARILRKSVLQNDRLVKSKQKDFLLIPECADCGSLNHFPLNIRIEVLSSTCRRIGKCPVPKDVQEGIRD